MLLCDTLAALDAFTGVKPDVVHVWKLNSARGDVSRALQVLSQLCYVVAQSFCFVV
jgi:hypothetical protein